MLSTVLHTGDGWGFEVVGRTIYFLGMDGWVGVL